MLDGEDKETVTHMEQCHPVTKQVCEMIHCTGRCRDMTNQKVKYKMLDMENKETRGYVWAVEMTPPCLLMKERARMGYTPLTLYMARQVCEEVHYKVS